ASLVSFSSIMDAGQLPITMNAPLCSSLLLHEGNHRERVVWQAALPRIWPRPSAPGFRQSSHRSHRGFETKRTTTTGLAGMPAAVRRLWHGRPARRINLYRQGEIVALARAELLPKRQSHGESRANYTQHADSPLGAGDMRIRRPGSGIGAN